MKRHGVSTPSTTTAMTGSLHLGTLRKVTSSPSPSTRHLSWFVLSNSLKMPFIWCPQGYWLTAAEYIDQIRSKLLPWVEANFPDNNVVLDQDGAPAHTARVTQWFLQDHIAFWGNLPQMPSKHRGPQGLCQWGVERDERGHDLEVVH